MSMYAGTWQLCVLGMHATCDAPDNLVNMLSNQGDTCVLHVIPMIQILPHLHTHGGLLLQQSSLCFVLVKNQTCKGPDSN